jgi:GTPase SAR1 family protein
MLSWTKNSTTNAAQTSPTTTEYESCCSCESPANSQLQVKERTGRLFDLINNLRSIGLEEIELPVVVVGGNQSVGKSLLVRGLTSLNLPAGDGTVTRTVTEIRLIKSDKPIHYSVIARTEYDKNAIKLDFPVERLVGETKNEEEVHNLVLTAQKQLLNPSAESSNIVYTNQGNELLFSPNVVCIKVEGAYVDLTLIDLPGIIQSISSLNNQNLIGMVEYTIKHYISKPNALIVAVISCKDEIENQAIFNWAKNVDPSGDRTIGVLTKPDTIESDTHSKWIDIALNKQYKLGLGYFIVKLPSKVQHPCQLTWDEMIRLENEYFMMNEPWAIIKKLRLGVPALRDELSNLLFKLIVNSIPELIHTTKRHLQLVKYVSFKVEQRLEEFPPVVSSNIQLELLQSIRHFSAVIGYHINAEQNLKVFVQKIRRHYEQFKCNILATKPMFIFPSELSLNEGSKQQPKSWFGSSSPSTTLNSPKLKQTPAAPLKYTIADAESIIQSQRGKELDGYPHSAITFLLKQSLAPWSHIQQELCQSVHADLNSLITKLSKDMFHRFPNLSKAVNLSAGKLLNKLFNSLQSQCAILLDIETNFTFTVSPQFALQKQVLLKQLMQHNGASYGVLELIASITAYYDTITHRFIDYNCLYIESFLFSSFARDIEKFLVMELKIIEGERSEWLVKEDESLSEDRRILEEKRSRFNKVLHQIQAVVGDDLQFEHGL